MEEVKTPAPVAEATPAPTPEPTVDPASLKSDDIRSLIEQKAKEPEAPKTPEIAQTQPEQKQEEWFDKEKGFKTKDDALKSYNELQNTLRQRAEEQKRMEAELNQFKQKANERPLTEEEKNREKSVKEWEEQNKEAIEFLEKRVAERLEKKKETETFEQSALNARQSWKQEFDKDESRRALWPTMEKIYAEKDVFRSFATNPLEAIEAMAFKKEFPSIAEKIRAEAIEQYKASIKEAAEAERRGKTEIPGGAKTLTGDLDAGKMSSSEIANMLRREDE